MIVVLAAEAENDLERIGDFIAQDNPGRAESFVEELRECCHRLAATPQGFPLVPGHESSGIRRRPHGNYLIFYRPTPSRIDVLHIMHGARDYERLLFPRK